MKKTFILMAVLALACTSKEKKAKYAELSQASWLVGAWENKSPEGTLSENWEKINDSLFHGMSYFILKNDTLHNETIELFQRDGKVTYQPTVIGQNNNQPIPFSLTKSSDSLLVFENPKHDYPQRIAYRKISNDSMVAEIAGIQQGRPSTEQYGFSRKQ